MENLLVFFHIPRTGGTFFNHAIGDWLSDEHWQRHYNYTENSSIMNLQHRDIPLLSHRTKEQNKQLKILSGHSVNCQSYKWVKTPKTPVYYSIVREPVERLLSSFNYKRQKAILWQEDIAFSHTMPQLDYHAAYEGKTHNDYDTLYEYLLDSTIETNLQSKWLAKSFFEWDYVTGSFVENNTYAPSSNAIITSNKTTTPDWLSDKEVLPSIDLIDLCIEKMWWISDFANIENNTKFVCEQFDLQYNTVVNNQKNSSRKIEPKWTIEDIKNQPDYKQLQNLLSLDYYLYEKVKLLKRPI